MGFSFYLQSQFRARLSEISHSRRRSKISALPKNDSLSSTHSKSVLGRRRHPSEVPPIKPSEYGQIRFEYTNPDAVGFVDESGAPMTLTDLFEHLIVFGGSGTGKTYSVMCPIWEECFRSTHLPDGKEREEKKFGALVVEAKGDFRDKTLSLAQKYGRLDDCRYFGPKHSLKYNLFGDPEESSIQKARKILTILKAFADGKASQDPFWDAAALKVFLNTFILHSHLKEARAAGMELNLPPMSFHLLNLILMDRGQPQNLSEITSAHKIYSDCFSKLEQTCQTLSLICRNMEMSIRDAEPIRAAISSKAINMEQGMGESPPEKALSSLREVKSIASAMSAILQVCPLHSGNANFGNSLAENLSAVRTSLSRFLDADSDSERGAAGSHVRDFTGLLAEAFGQRLAFFDSLSDTEGKESPFRAIRDLFMEFNDAALRIISLRDKCSRLAKQIPQPQVGALQTLLVQYESYLKAKGVRQEDDPVWAYFRGEYLAVANEKTAGSVAMVASNLTGLFVHPPFSDIFCADGNFNFNSVIDEGLIVYLDMPTAYYGPAATIAMLCLKIDFFRCMLSRPRLFQRDASGAYTDTLVNQVRPVIYFCDEFGSVITTGEETGEAGYLDKVREFRGSCLLGTQSISRLLTKVPETEIDSILTNTAIKIFLGNDDLKTNDYASKILGDRIRVNANLNQGAMEGFLSDKGKTGSRDFTTTSQKEAKFSGADFGRLQKGHAIVSLNKRFGKRRVQRLNFKGKPLAPPDTSPGWSVTPPALATT